ncbi:aminopeptidase [Aliifodinibius sp. S!AR15-10]|uniref:aminopeptidase n=1 Tax=Aliifodinibius sp. S!AR15-10 TaxID=2950437 RepID=UPI00285ADD04|nr:aminopeptidase [Aliifodinibius sp. S!AR15-10]MDR8391243.1 aminopeptidase [Aliifodinibius sp. S!AR15-10]
MYTSQDAQLAKKILHFSCELEEGQNVLLQLVGLNGVGLLRALVKEAREMNVNPFVQIEDTEIRRMLIENGDKKFWEKQAQTDQLPLMKQMDAFVGIRASQNIYEQADVSKKANKDYSDYFLKPVHLEERVNNTNWVVLRYPSEAFAMNAKMPTEKFREFYYKACLLDYSQLHEAMKPLEERLRKTDIIQLKGEGTDIQFSVKDQNWITCFGKRNIPDGELFSSPILSSVEGHISYAPSVYQGKPFEFVKLEVRDGVVVDFDSSNNDALEEILDTDAGARQFGEFSFGLNPIIKEPMYDILFDEKIYGSNHLTLGKDYEEAPNGNDSSIHWDLVCIGADVYLDGEKIREGRKFVTEDLQGLNPENLV